MIVVDCSYAMAVVIPDERQPASWYRAADQQLVAPSIWPLDMANALRCSVKRKRVKHEQVAGICADLEGLGIETVASSTLRLEQAYSAAQRYDLSTYDASYLELALQRRYSLATLDARLAAAASAVGLVVVS